MNATASNVFFIVHLQRFAIPACENRDSDHLFCFWAAPGQRVESLPGRLLQLAGELLPARLPEFLTFNHEDLKRCPQSSLKLLSYRAASRISTLCPRIPPGICDSYAAPRTLRRCRISPRFRPGFIPPSFTPSFGDQPFHLHKPLGAAQGSLAIDPPDVP